MVAHICNPSTQEALGLSEYKSSLDYRERFCLKKKKERKKGQGKKKEQKRKKRKKKLFSSIDHLEQNMLFGFRFRLPLSVI